jgi:hypothetical protein
VRRAVFFDIDGTLLDFQNWIPESTVRAIRALRANGHYAFLCSGRARSYIQNPSLLGIGFDGVVAACGTHVELGEQMLYEYLIDRELAEYTVKTVRTYGFRPILEGPKHLYMDDVDFGHEPYGKKLKRDMGEMILPITGLEGQWKMNKLSCATDHADLEGCFAALQEHYTYLVHTPEVVELVPKGHTKATGMQHVCEALGISREDTVAFGDSVNDLDMLSYAGVGVAMGNGSEEAKAAADMVTDKLEEHGILHGLEQLGLL